jgi:hypothetical protein
MSLRDDDLPLYETWLESVGFQREKRIDGSLSISVPGDTVKIVLYPREGSWLMSLLQDHDHIAISKEFRTRGELRMFCNSIGFSLVAQEPSIVPRSTAGAASVKNRVRLVSVRQRRLRTRRAGGMEINNELT